MASQSRRTKHQTEELQEARNTMKQTRPDNMKCEPVWLRKNETIIVHIKDNNYFNQYDCLEFWQQIEMPAIQCVIDGQT
jgi:hypothetical protein